MVHSGSASPMKTTPTASPHLTLPATAPPLQAAPLVPPAGDTTDQGLTQTPEKFITTDLTSKSDSTKPSPPTPADGEPAVVTPAKALVESASAWSSAQTPTPTQGTANGRTSGRKRTPKACKCCGPNSQGHNVRTPSRGRGRGRGRGRDAGSDLQETAKRKPGDGQLTPHIKSFDLATKKEEKAEEEDGRSEKMHMTDTQPQTVASLPVPVSLQDGPIKNSDALNKGDASKKEAMLLVGSGLADNAQGEGAGDGSNVALSLSGVAGRGIAVVRGRGVRGVLQPATSTIFLTSQSFALPRSMLVQRLVPKTDVVMDHGAPTEQAVVKAPLGNGDTVNLCDTEPEQEAKEDHTIISEVENGQLFVSLSSPASGSGSPQDLDSEMHVDQAADKTVLGTLSNGSIGAPMAEDHCSTHMEVESSHLATVAPQPQGPITVSSLQHVGALRDHRLYCQTGTWVEEETGRGGEVDEKMQDGGESLEQLVDLIHEFLESFYVKYGGFIPLSEDDVLEYLKKRGSSDISNRGLDIKREMTRYRAGLASAPVAGFMVTYNKHTLGLEDLGTLEEQNWLNDQIINMYGELIMEATQQKVHFFNSFFHKQLVAKGYDGVKRWTKKVDLFSKWLLLIPIHLEIHWSLVTVTMATKTISYYDSQGIVFRHTTDNIMKYLLSEAREKKQTAFQKGWKITIIKGIPQQKNDSDCGVFVLEYCRRLSVKQPLLFSQEDMPRIRKRIYKELCDCHLND